MKIKLSKSQWELIGQKTGWMTEAKKKGKKKSPKEHGFIDQCIKENQDKDNPGGYCASIVDKVKGTTDWRKEAKKDKWIPKDLKEGRFTSYCKQQGFDGPCEECAKKAMESDDASVRGMAQFYRNVAKK